MYENIDNNDKPIKSIIWGPEKTVHSLKTAKCKRGIIYCSIVKILQEIYMTPTGRDVFDIYHFNILQRQQMLKKTVTIYLVLTNSQNIVSGSQTKTV